MSTGAHPRDRGARPAPAAPRPRTLALVLVVPPLLLTLFRYVFDGQPETFDRVGGPLVGIFPFISMFLVTSIAMLRERTTGTLERLMSMPIGKLDLLLGYGLAFALVAACRRRSPPSSLSACSGSTPPARSALVVAIAIANALLGMALGLFLSAFASDGVPGGAVHAGLRDAADPARADCSCRATGWPTARVALGRAAAHVRVRRARAGDATAVDAGSPRNLGVVVGCITLALALGAATLAESRTALRESRAALAEAPRTTASARRRPR